MQLARLWETSHSKWAFACLLLISDGCDWGGNTQRVYRETGPVDVSVVPEMLVGAQYRGRTGGDQYDDMMWRFDETHFRIVNTSVCSSDRVLGFTAISAAYFLLNSTGMSVMLNEEFRLGS